MPSEEQQKKLRAMRRVIADAFTFVRSQEANQAIATVTLDQLMAEQIARDGESDGSQQSTFAPYSFDTSSESEEEASTDAAAIGPAFVTGATIDSASKLDRLEAIKNSLSDAIKNLKEISPEDVAELEEYSEEDGPLEAIGNLASDAVEWLSDVFDFDG